MSNRITNRHGKLASVEGLGVDALRLKALRLMLEFRRDLGYDMDPRVKSIPLAKAETGLRTTDLARLIAGVDAKLQATIAACEIVHEGARVCACGEPETGGAFGWFDGPNGITRCLACGREHGRIGGAL